MPVTEVVVVFLEAKPEGKFISVITHVVSNKKNL